MSFNAGDLDEALEELNVDELTGEAISEEAPFWGETGYDVIMELDEPFEIKVNDEIVRVEVKEVSTGTYHDDTYIILEAGGRTFRKFGWTASHEGTYWEGSCNEVEPYEVTETRWRTKR